MKQCKKCAWYQEWYDNLISSGDDVIIEGEEPIEKHYCHVYTPFGGDGNECIPQEVVEDKKDCWLFIEKTQELIDLENSESLNNQHKHS